MDEWYVAREDTLHITDDVYLNYILLLSSINLFSCIAIVFKCTNKDNI